MTKQSSVIGDAVASRARGLDQYLTKIEILHSEGLLSSRDAERAYIGGFLEFHAFVERSIEQLFIGLLRGGLQSSDRSIKARIKVSSSLIAHDIVKGERQYVDWLPYEQYTTRRAQSFFAGLLTVLTEAIFVRSRKIL